MTLDSRNRAVAVVKQELFEASTFERPSHRDQRAVLSFPPFHLDVAEERLWKNGRELRLRPKPFAILRYLTRHPRRLVTQSEIVDAVWGKIAMSDSLLRTHIRDLRRVLGERVIETVVGRGYRFVADVSEIDEARNGRGLSGKPPLELVRTSEGPGPEPAVRTAESARVLEELTHALTTLAINATVHLHSLKRT
jgi:DNA-binding winged helix-turn-helix (wHTH) protein